MYTMLDKSVKPPPMETIKHFMDRMWTQDLTKVSLEDMTTLLVFAGVGAKQLVDKDPFALVPTAE